MKQSIGKRELHSYEQILANQDCLKRGWLYIAEQDLCDYETAKAQSPEAGEEFLARRKEQNRIEAENPPVKPAPQSKPVLPPLPLSETMVLMQKIAQDGVLLELDENKELRALGWRPVVEKWVPKVLPNQGAFTQTLSQISSTHGDTDPLNLRELADEVNFYRACDRLRELQDTHGFVKAVCLHSEEENANMVYAEFPKKPAENEGDSFETCK